MKIASFGGHAINDGTSYTAVWDGALLGLGEHTVKTLGRVGRTPRVSGVVREGRTLAMRIYIRGASTAALQRQLLGWLDPANETSQELVVTDTNGTNSRYVMAVCEFAREEKSSAGLCVLAVFMVDGDTAWRHKTLATQSWAVTSSGDSEVVANDGDLDAYPKLTITPTSAKASDGYGYRRFVDVVWKASEGAANYPVDLGNDAFDTDALVTASKMQADGDDLRVFVDGVEVRRWLDGINTTTTKVWVNLTFAAKQAGTLVETVDITYANTYITLNEDISGWPDSGYFKLDSEVMSYTGKNVTLKRLTGITRGVNGVVTNTGAPGDAINWVQHEIWIMYGNASVSAPTVNDDYKPMFNLATSTNTSWDYDEFFKNSSGRSAKWTKAHYGSTPTITTYTANQFTLADPATEMGIALDLVGVYGAWGMGAWVMSNPCGITGANFANGEKYATHTFDAKIQSSIDGATWVDEDTIAAPSATSTWESWSDNETLATGSKYVRLALSSSLLWSGMKSRVEAADVTLALDSTYTPAPVISSAEDAANYILACTITNSTTGESIKITHTLTLADDLEIDTDLLTVVDPDTGENHLPVLEIWGALRKDWLRLAPGNNTLVFTDTGTAAVTVALTWEERYYDG